MFSELSRSVRRYEAETRAPADGQTLKRTCDETADRRLAYSSPGTYDRDRASFTEVFVIRGDEVKV